MEARRRQPSASASTSHSHDDRKTPVKGSGGVTPTLEVEDDAPPRRTRGRNPLPPQKGPLFPPLPPRPAKNSPKNSPKTASRSPSGKGVRLASSSALSSAVGDDSPKSAAMADAEAPAPGADTADTRDNRDRSMSSLSPALPVDDDMDVDPPVPSGGKADPGIGLGRPADGDDWDAYHRRRGVRSFSGAKSGGVKVEPIEANTVSEDLSAEATADPEAPAEAGAEASAEVGAENSTENDGAGTGAAGDDEAEAGGEAETSNGAAEHDERSEKETSVATSAEPSLRTARKRRGEEQLLLDDHLLPKEMRQHAPIPPRRDKSVKRDEAPAKEEPAEADEAEADPPDDEAGDDAEEGDEDAAEITRCVCKREEEVDVMMIACEKCNVWQHGACMGIWGDDEAPDEYFCEECRPDLHGPLKKWMRHCGRNPANFIAPEPEDLLKLWNNSDKYPPSQSKRWATELPPPPAKPPSRSHRKKEDDESRRVSRRAEPAEKAPRPPSSKDTARERRRAGRRQSTDLSLSGSPPPGGRHEPKKRSTMNSRDAAYEEAVKAALEASRREASGEKEEPPVVEERKRRRPDNDEGEQAEPKKGKKKEKKDEEDSEATPVPPSKPKHPNQYTYRPKGERSTAAASPRPSRGTPQPSIPPPTHEHGTRRAGAIANNLASQPYQAMTVHNLNWYLPDHLQPCSDLLDTPTPVPLEVPSPRNLQYLPRTHFLNQKYGPFTDERDEEGRLILPDDKPLREVEGEPVNHREPPTRIRYPMKRITTSEMRKRVRNLLEYVGRVQDEEARRAERAARIGIPSTSAPRPRLPPLGEERRRAHSSLANGDGNESPQPPPSPARPPPPSASQLLDEFTRDLIAFQEAFNSGDFESLPFAQPRPRAPAPDAELTPDPALLPEPVVEGVNGEGLAPEQTRADNTAMEVDEAVEESAMAEGKAPEPETVAESTAEAAPPTEHEPVEDEVQVKQEAIQLVVEDAISAIPAGEPPAVAAVEEAAEEPVEQTSAHALADGAASDRSLTPPPAETAESSQQKKAAVEAQPVQLEEAETAGPPAEPTLTEPTPTNSTPADAVVAEAAPAEQTEPTPAEATAEPATEKAPAAEVVAEAPEPTDAANGNSSEISEPMDIDEDDSAASAPPEPVAASATVEGAPPADGASKVAEPMEVDMDIDESTNGSVPPVESATAKMDVEVADPTVTITEVKPDEPQAPMLAAEPSAVSVEATTSAVTATASAPASAPASETEALTTAVLVAVEPRLTPVPELPAPASVSSDASKVAPPALKEAVEPESKPEDENVAAATPTQVTA